MNRKRRTEILISGSMKAAEKLASDIEEKKINEALRKEQSKINMTKVSFDNMEI